MALIASLPRPARPVVRQPASAGAKGSLRMVEPDQRLLMLIDNDAAQCRVIGALAGREGWRVLSVDESEKAIATLGTRQGMQLSAIILDQAVPGDRACELISELKQRRPALPILMLTSSTSPQLAVEAMRPGVTDYLVKPVSPDRLMQALRNSTTREAPGDELIPLSEKMSSQLDFDTMVGTAPAFRDALAKAAKAARGHGNVLIEGESGTGKEMLVRAMHSASPRAKTAFRMINIAGVSASNLESRLFGHEKGAFAGAFDQHVGAFQHCDGGTLVIDEIDRLSLEVQDRLISVLESGSVKPLGAQYGFKIDVRLIAASNLPLADMVATGHFRAELLKLLSRTHIVLPPLRERDRDVGALARYFLHQIGQQPGLRPLGITGDALRLLGAFEWPGNVRQLKAVLFRAAVFCDGDALTAEDFPQLREIIGETEPATNGRIRESAGVQLYTEDGNLRPLEEIEADVIRLAIGHYRGRMTEVARRLGIGRSTLYRKLSDLGIDNAA